MADFAHDDLMFASRIAGLRRKPRRAAGGDFAGDFAAAGGEDPLLRVLVGAALAERQQRQADALQRAAEAERFNRERSATKEDADTKWQRALQAQVAANRRADEVGARQRGYAVEDRDAGLKERGDERKHTEGREDARDKIARIRQLTDYVAQARANGDDLAPELLAELEQLTGAAPAARQPATGGSGLTRDQRQALMNSAFTRITERVRSGEITEAEAQEEMARVRDPSAALRIAAPAPKRSGEQEVGDLIRASTGKLRGKMTDTTAKSLFGGLDADEALKTARDAAIERLLRDGKTPDEIGYLAKSQLLEQKDLPIGDSSTMGKVIGETAASPISAVGKLLGIGPAGTLESDSVFKGDRYAPHEYGEHWRQRALELQAALRG